MFFAGHGSDHGTGNIHLNPTDSVTLGELSHALESAIARGLQLAIFNCCSGLKLGSDLAMLNMPTVIVMREAIPNHVAQSFLRDFLKSFAQGNPLLTAVRHARQQLQVLERVFPCATWLPVVFWNPLVPMPSCKILQFRQMAQVWWVVAAAALLVTTGVWVVRSQGILEPIELITYDLAMNSGWIKEAPDPRILVVGINEEDFSKLRQNNPLADRTVAQVIENLRLAQPRAIGVDIYRDQPQGIGQPELQAALQNKQVISVCQMPGSNRAEFSVVSSPSGVQPHNVGFTNFAADPDKVVRRQLLGMAIKDPRCPTDHDESLQSIVPLGGGGVSGVATPTFWVYSPYVSPVPLRGLLVVRRAQNYLAEPLHMAEVVMSGRPGLVGVKLPVPIGERGLLEWSLTVVCDRENESRNPFVTGWVLVRPGSVSSRVVGSSRSEQVEFFARSGYWYDALTAAEGDAARHKLLEAADIKLVR